MDPTDIPCNGTTKVTLTLDGQGSIALHPEDIMLTLDRSGSMGGSMSALKNASKNFVDIIDEETDGSKDGIISGSRIGVVSFAGSASVDQVLTNNATAVKEAIDALSAGGLTNHKDAIIKAQKELNGSGSSAPNATNSKDMVLFTDGGWNVGGNPHDAAEAAKAQGTVIFAIGLGSVNQTALEDLASDPPEEHVYITPNASELKEIFEKIAKTLVPAGTNIEVIDTVNSHFAVSGESATKGTVTKVGNVITWTIRELMTETATMTYTATHDNTQPGGTEKVNDNVTYTDDEGNIVTFPDPTVNVHGCAANLMLDPKNETNELGTFGQTHTVTATVTDDFNASVANILVNFNIPLGPNIGTSNSGNTDSSGEANFTYTAMQGLAGLGMDDIIAVAPRQSNVYRDLDDWATKEWIDTTPPVVECFETVNPAGKKIPPAGKTTLPGPKGGQNEDGFYELLATDIVDPNPQIFVLDTGSGIVFGPFASGTKIKYTEANGATPSMKPMGGPNSAIAQHIKGTGDAAVYAVDASGNVGTMVSCLVAPLPK